MSRAAPATPSAKRTKRSLPDRYRARQRDLRERKELREFMADVGDDGADPSFKERLRAELKARLRERFSRG